MSAQALSTEEREILALLRQEDEKAMERIFDTYYAYLVRTAYHVLLDEHQAKDLVQDVLFSFWQKKDSLKIDTGLKAYLRRSVVNRCIDQTRRKKRIGITEEITDFNQASQDSSIEEVLDTENLQQAIFAAIETLPERCKLIFSLSRFEDLSHKEIAAKLDISPKTIENQMTKALKVVRMAVNKYKALSISLFLYFFG